MILKKHGPYVKNPYNGAYYLITHIFPIDIDEIEHTNLSPLNLLNYYFWQDGSLCGKNED